MLDQLGAHVGSLMDGGGSDQDAKHHASEANAMLGRIERLTRQMRGNTQRAWQNLVSEIRGMVQNAMSQE